MSTDKSNPPDMRTIMVGRQSLRTALWRGTGHGRPILFFNGIGANLEIAQPLGDALSDRDVITFDLPGVGGSPSPATPYRPWWVARAAKQILLAHGIDEPVDVMGVSWGGGAAQQFAFQYQKRVNKLVLVATSPGVTMVPGDIRALSKMAHPMRYTNQDFLTQHFKTLYGDEPNGAEMFSRNMKPPQLKGYLFQLAAMAGWSSLPFLPLLPHETLILAGDRDKIVPLANAQILAFMIRRSRLEVVKDGGHLFLLSQADNVLPLLKDFLDTETQEKAMPDLSLQPAE